MSKRVKEWARKAREQLIEELGGRCANCGVTEKLQFDCKEPRGHDHHRGSTDQRMVFYRKEHKIGNLQLLCASCNTHKANTHDQRWYDEVDPWSAPDY